MAPEQGSTISMFGVDEATLDYLELTGRDEEHIELVREYFDAQGLFGEQNPEYSETVEFDLSTITPSLAGPKKPQDRVAMGDMKTHFRGLVHGEFEEELDDIDEEAITRWLGESSASDDRPDPDLPEPDVGDLDKRVAVDVNSEGRSPSGSRAEPGDGETTEIGHGSVVVSAITSCTNTSNPSVMIAAGLLARNAVERGLDVPAYVVKTSLARRKPRRHRISRSVGASPVPRRPRLQRRRLRLYDLYRERRPASRADRTCDRRRGSLDHERPFGEPQLRGSHPPEDSCELPRQPAARRRLWPRRADGHRPRTRPARNGCRRRSGLSRGHLARRRRRIHAAVHDSVDSSMFEEKYASVFEGDERWTALDAPTGEVYEWDDSSTYIREPPFFKDFPLEEPGVTDIDDARTLMLLGDTVTTDHISPAGPFSREQPAGEWLAEQGVEPTSSTPTAPGAGTTR